MSTPQQEALNKALAKSIRRVKDKGRYVSPNGVKYRSKAEKRKMMKGLPKSDGKGSVAFPVTDEQKREHQRRFKRAWNE